jgi:hypothetical protein
MLATPDTADTALTRPDYRRPVHQPRRSKAAATDGRRNLAAAPHDNAPDATQVLPVAARFARMLRGWPRRRLMRIQPSRS